MSGGRNAPPEFRYEAVGAPARYVKNRRLVYTAEYSRVMRLIGKMQKFGARVRVNFRPNLAQKGVDLAAMRRLLARDTPLGYTSEGLVVEVMDVLIESGAHLDDTA